MKKSPFSTPFADLPIKEWAPSLPKPTRENIESFSNEAEQLLKEIWSKQRELIRTGKYQVDWLKGQHFLIAGATGPGLGCSLANAIINNLDKNGSLTILSRDLKRSLAFETGTAMTEKAKYLGFQDRFQWLNDGIAVEGKAFDKIVNTLQNVGANHVIYINTVAAAYSGLLPGYPPVFVKDVDENGLFQWQLPSLSDKNIETTKYIMGTMAVQFPDQLEKENIKVKTSAFADTRASVDRISRDPSAIEYGRQGAYSTSLYLPKEIIHQATSAAYKTDKMLLDFFFPFMRTRALQLVPGGVFMSFVFDKIMELEGIKRIDIPELALAMLDEMGRAIHNKDFNPFIFLDRHESCLDLWFYELIQRINNDINSDFYYKKWMPAYYDP